MTGVQTCALPIYPTCNPVVAGVDGKSLAEIECPSYKIFSVEWDRCVSGPPTRPVGLYRGGVLCFWAVCRIHNNGSNVLFCDGHAKWMNPSNFHSSTDHIDSSGNPCDKQGNVLNPADIAVAENIWRKYWDTAYDVN